MHGNETVCVHVYVYSSTAMERKQTECTYLVPVMWYGRTGVWAHLNGRGSEKTPGKELQEDHYCGMEHTWSAITLKKNILKQTFNT